MTEASSFILRNNTLPCDSTFYLQIQGNANEYIIPIGHHAKKFMLYITENRFRSFKRIF